MEAQRALLDELMGKDRNLTEEEKKGYREMKWDDKEVCAYYMVRFCSHDLFVNADCDLALRSHQDMMHMCLGLQLNLLSSVRNWSLTWIEE